MDRFRLFGLVMVATLATACVSTTGRPAATDSATPSPATADSAVPAQEDEAFNNTLKWSTASEVDNFGFDIYRGDSEEGPFVRLNETPIAGAGTSDVPTYYEYVDDTIDPRRGYYYYIESISISGERERFTPVNYAKPKIEPAATDDEGD